MVFRQSESGPVEGRTLFVLIYKGNMGFSLRTYVPDLPPVGHFRSHSFTWLAFSYSFT